MSNAAAAATSLLLLSASAARLDAFKIAQIARIPLGPLLSLSQGR
jgi:hypothetical protein